MWYEGHFFLLHIAVGGNVVPDSITGEADDLRGRWSPQILLEITGSTPGWKSARAVSWLSSGLTRPAPVAVKQRVSVVEGRFFRPEGRSPPDVVTFCSDVILGLPGRLKTGGRAIRRRRHAIEGGKDLFSRAGLPEIHSAPSSMLGPEGVVMRPRVGDVVLERGSLSILASLQHQRLDRRGEALYEESRSLVW